MEQEIKCLICGSKRIGFFCQKQEYKLYRCLDCGLIFVWPIPEGLENIYSEFYFKQGEGDRRTEKFGYTDYEKDKEAARGTFVVYLDKVSLVAQTGRILDVGAATGYFLDLAKARGWKTAGTEISAYAAGLAKNKGHEIFLGDLPDIKTEKKYDVVTAWDVLEHLSDPSKYLRSIYDVLNNGGILAVNTIDSSSWWARLWGRSWHAILPPEHLFYYSAKSLKILFENSGFKIIETAKIGKQFTLPYIFKILAHRYNSLFLRKVSDFFNKLGVKIGLPVNLRDNIFIIAVK